MGHPLDPLNLMHRRIDRRTLLAAGSAAAGLAALRPTGRAFGQAATPTGTVTVVHPSALQTMDPNINVQEVVRTVVGPIYDRVIEFTADAQLKPMLAESWQTVGDATWEFKLRQGVTFHDGTPFNAEVLKHTLERIFDPTFNSVQKTYWVPITRIDVPDEFTIQVTTETPMGTMPYTMALTMPVHPDVSFDPAAFPASPIGTGPFKFVEWVKDDRVVLEANESYWGGPPKVQQVIFRTIPELSTRMSALEAGEIDISLEIVPEDAERLAGSGDITIQQVQTFRTSWLWMNPQREPFADPRVRQAVRQAVDLEAIAQSIIAGVGIKAQAPIAPTVFGFNPDLPPIEYNPDAAKALLAEAGFPDGFDTTVTGLGAAGGYTRFGDVSLVVIDQLAQVGIRAEPITKDAATAEKDLLALNWDMTFAGATAATGDADSGLARLYLSSANRTGWANEEVDAQLMIGRQSTVADERLAAYKRAQEILWAEGPTLWTYHHIDTVGVRNRVQGFAARPDRVLDIRGVSVTD